MTESAKKIAKLNAPKIEYYHAIQKTDDKEVDRTARAIIDNPTRVAYRKRVADDKKFQKTVSSASALLRSHNKMKPMKNPKIGKKL